VTMAARQLRRAVLASALLLAPPLTLADCDQRMNAWVEVAKQPFSAAPLNHLGRQFVSKATLANAFALDQRCRLGARYSTRIKATLAGSMSTQPAGSEQTASRARVRSLLHEAYLTINAPGEVLIDLGKQDIANGYLLFLSPMDVMRNPINPPPDGLVNLAGPSWRTSYREGSIGLRGTKFMSAGTLELGVFPALDGDPGTAPLAQWSSWQRSNARARVYAAYSANLWDSFNPKVVMVSTSGRNTVAIGTSGALAAGVILTVEAAHSSRSQVQRVSAQAAGLLFAGGFPLAGDILETIPRASRQLAAGVRINGPRRTTVIAEFYYQADGYSRADWNRYFQFTDYTLAAWASSRFQPYLDYQRLLLSAADSNQRRDLLLGKHYLTLGLERSSEGTNKLGWHLSLLGNADDHSALMNLHLTTSLAPEAELYLGARAMLGRKRSEFGRFGRAPLVYAGLNFSL